MAKFSKQVKKLSALSGKQWYKEKSNKIQEIEEEDVEMVVEEEGDEVCVILLFFCTNSNDILEFDDNGCTATRGK